MSERTRIYLKNGTILFVDSDEFQPFFKTFKNHIDESGGQVDYAIFRFEKVQILEPIQESPRTFKNVHLKWSEVAMIAEEQ